MVRRTGLVLAVSLLVGSILSAGLYLLLQEKQAEDEALFVEQHIDRRVTMIDQSIRRSARQLDLLVAYYEASPKIDSHGMAGFLQSVWTNFPDNEAYGALPIAMGWIDISRAPEDTVIVYQDGSEQTIDIEPAFHALLDETIIAYKAEARALLTRGRPDWAKFDEDGGRYLTALKPVFRVSERANRVMRGTVYAIFDLQALIAGTVREGLHEPLLQARFSRYVSQGGVVDEVARRAKTHAPFVPVETSHEHTLKISDLELSLNFFRDAGWSYLESRPWRDVVAARVRDAALIGIAAAVLVYLVGSYYGLQNRRLWQLTTKAEDGARAKADFLATMSHEIRTPMNGIFGMTELLSKTELTEQQRRYTDTILFSAEVLLAVVDDILDYSKLETGKMTLDPVPSDVEEMVKNVVDLLAVKARHKAIELNMRVGRDVPSRIVVDPVRFKQLLMNLVGNAIKFTEAGQITVGIAIVADAIPDPRERRFRVTVSDTGVGIAEKDMGHIFTRFSQADNSTTRKFGGSGLGLSICKQIVDLMGGEIGVESEVGKGSTFWFEIVVPVARADMKPALSYDSFKGRRILVVDDIRLSAELMGDVLTAAGADVHVTLDPEAAYSQLQMAAQEGRRFELALIDYQMPTLKGDELAKMVRSDAALSGMPLVLVSSVNPGMLKMVVEGGLFDGAVSKPFSPQSLLAEVSTRLDAGWRTPGRVATRAVASITRLSSAHTQESARPDVAVRGADAPSSQPGEVDDAAASKPFTGRRVLVAEDSLINQAYVKETLMRLGCRVSLAANGEEAVRMCGAGRFDAVVMDCHMPIMNGYDAAMEIRRMIQSGMIPYVPVIALTADVGESNRQRCLLAGMSDFLTKPAKQATLESALARWFEELDRRNGVTVAGAALATTPSPTLSPPPEAERADGPLSAAASCEPAQGGQFAGAKVLVVEDNEVNQAYLRETLSQLGCVASVAANGKEAIAKAEAGSHDLVLMDCHMPVMNGYEATRALIRMMDEGVVAKAPIVALTADVVQDNEERCRSAGMVDCVAKPVGQDVLGNVLERWLTSGADSAPAAAGSDIPQGVDMDDYVDAEVLRQGQDLFQEEFWPLVDRFIVDVNANLDMITTSLSRFELAAIHRPVHSIKSSSRQIGAMHLGNVAAEVEEQVMPETDIDPNALGPAIAELQRVVAATCDALRDMRPK